MSASLVCVSRRNTLHTAARWLEQDLAPASCVTVCPRSILAFRQTSSDWTTRADATGHQRRTNVGLDTSRLNLVGESGIFRAALKMLERLTACEATVLIKTISAPRRKSRRAER
jgi:hypothetical protein